MEEMILLTCAEDSDITAMYDGRLPHRVAREISLTFHAMRHPVASLSQAPS